MSDTGEDPCLGHHWHALEAEEADHALEAEETGAAFPDTGGAPLPAVVEALVVASGHLELAEGLWHRPGQGALALAHRLAAAVILSLIGDDSRHWRLSPLVRDIVTLGEEALPSSVDALGAMLEEAGATPFRTLVERLAGDLAVAERRFEEVVGLVSAVAREVAAPP